MNKQYLKYYLIFIYTTVIVLLFCYRASAQTVPVWRLTNWSNAGLDYPIQEPVKLINFLDAGGKNDGTTSNDSVLNQILATAPVTIYFPNGEYNFTQTITLPSNVTIHGESADSTIFNFDMIGNSNLISITGQATNDTFSIANDALMGSKNILLNNISGIQAGDLIRIMDNDSAFITSSWALHSTGQLLMTDSATGNRIFFSTELRRSYIMANYVILQKIIPVRNVVITNITLNSQHATTTQTSNIYMSFAYNCHVKCIKSYKANFAHIDVRNSSRVLIEGSFFKDAWSYGGGGKGYGVVLHHTTGDCRVSDNIFNHLRHSLLLQAGANGNVISYNYSTNPYWTGVALPSNSAGDLVLHGNWPYRNLFEGNIVQNIVIDDSHGKNGPNNVFLRNRAELFGVFMNNSPATDSLIFIGNETTGSGLFYGNFSIAGTGHYSYGNSQKGSLYPTGTGTPSISSLYLSSAPPYYQNWPLIGMPNSLNANNNRAMDNFTSGFFTLCSASVTAGKPVLKKSDDKFAIYPNPAINLLFIKGDISQIKKVNIFDFTGKICISTRLKPEIRVNALAKGIYFVEIETIHGNTQTLKLIKH